MKRVVLASALLALAFVAVPSTATAKPAPKLTLTQAFKATEKYVAKYTDVPARSNCTRKSRSKYLCGFSALDAMGAGCTGYVTVTKKPNRKVVVKLVEGGCE